VGHSDAIVLPAVLKPLLVNTAREEQVLVPFHRQPGGDKNCRKLLA
jgi:hypothetical protein